MDSWLIVFLVVQLITIIAFVRLGERVYTLRERVQSNSTRLLLTSWIVWCIAMILSAAFWVFVLFGGRIFPGLSSLPWYRPALVIINAIFQLGTAYALERAWRKLTE